MDESTIDAFRFGVFELDLQTMELRRKGVKIRVQEQPLKLLALLLEHPGELITREELQQKLWPDDTFVDFDHGLNIAINRLRKVLGDSANNPLFIETLPRKGYRFLDQVSIISRPNLASKKAKGKHSIVLPAIIIIAALFTGWIILYYQIQNVMFSINRSEQTPVTSILKETAKSIAVLPFEDLSPTKDQDYFSDGLADSLITKLSQVKDLHVTARTSSFHFKGKSEDMRTIGETLGVSYLLEGSVQKSGNQLRIIAQLIKAKNGYHLWSETYDLELKDIFTIQDEIIKAVTEALSITLGVGEFVHPGMTRNIVAYDEYLRGWADLIKYTPDSILRAIDKFKNVLDIDESFGLAWLSLSSAYDEAIFRLPPEQTVNFTAKAAEALKHARVIAPGMPELLMITALQSYQNGDWLEADRIYIRIVDEQGHANSDANLGYGQMLIRAGRAGDALPYLQRAKRLNPLASGISFNLSIALLNLERIDEALFEARSGKKLEQLDDTGFILIEVLAAFENNDRARAAANITRNFNLEGDYPNPTLLRLAEILLIKNKKAALSELKALSKGSNIPPFTRMFFVHVASELGYPELAFENLMESGAFFLGAFFHPTHKALRQLPTFKTSVREIGLYDYWRESGKWGDYCRPVGDNDFECD